MRRPERTPSCGATECQARIAGRRRCFRSGTDGVRSTSARASRSQAVTCCQSGRSGSGGDQVEFESQAAIGAGAGNQRQPFADGGQAARPRPPGATRVALRASRVPPGRDQHSPEQKPGRAPGRRRRFPPRRRPGRRRLLRRCNPPPWPGRRAAARSRPGREPDSGGEPSACASATVACSTTVTFSDSLTIASATRAKAGGGYGNTQRPVSSRMGFVPAARCNREANSCANPPATGVASALGRVPQIQVRRSCPPAPRWPARPENRIAPATPPARRRARPPPPPPRPPRRRR